MDYFKAGAEVEISSEEVGLRGSWFAGTVIKKARNGNILVEYKTLKEDDCGNRPLREEVDFIMLRPLAPREAHREFVLTEEVDAYYNDGWWEGIITAFSPKKGKFGVFFRSNRELKYFDPSRLRLHREWLNGTWVPPLESGSKKDDKKTSPEDKGKKADKETVVKYSFRLGTFIEVRTDEDGFEGAWIPATVIKKLEGEKYMIQYKSLRNEEDTDFLKEEIDRTNIRPNPPETPPVDLFGVHEKVDAYFNDCWWVGEISKVFREKKYLVYFPGTDDDMEFKHSDLRKHQDWVDGKWIIPS